MCFKQAWSRQTQVTSRLFYVSGACMSARACVCLYESFLLSFVIVVLLVSFGRMFINVCICVRLCMFVRVLVGKCLPRYYLSICTVHLFRCVHASL